MSELDEASWELSGRARSPRPNGDLLGSTGTEQTPFPAEKHRVAERRGAESGALPPDPADLACVIKVLAALTPEHVQALVTLAQAMKGKS
jgi:hypothetical protein